MSSAAPDSAFASSAKFGRGGTANIEAPELDGAANRFCALPPPLPMPPPRGLPRPAAPNGFEHACSDYSS